MQEIVNGAEEATVKDLRNDLEQYGGTNDVTFIYGDEKKGLFHIADKHGGIKTLLKVLDTVVDGNITEFTEKNKTVHLMKGGIEAILSLDEHGKKKTWLLTGFDTKISPDAEREFNATLRATQTKPTFSRQDLGAGLNEFNIAPTLESVNQKGEKIKGSFDRLTKSIKITKEADFSTYQHEFAHFWLDNIWDYANSGKASEEYIKQFNELKKWLGVKPNQNYFTRAQLIWKDSRVKREKFGIKRI